MIEVVKLDKAEPHMRDDGSRSYTLTWDKSSCVSCPVWTEVTLADGDLVELHWDGDSHWGAPLTAAYKVESDARSMLFYKSQRYTDAQNAKWKAERTMREERGWALNADKFLADIELLGPELRARMERFVAEHGGLYELYTNMGEYELFVCTEAQKIVDEARNRGWSSEEVHELYKMNEAEVQAKGIQISEGHSGNTWGGAFGLAAAIMRGVKV